MLLNHFSNEPGAGSLFPPFILYYVWQ